MVHDKLKGAHEDEQFYPLRETLEEEKTRA